MFGGRKKIKHVVVSYASADRREAQELVGALEAEGLRVWVAPRDIDPSRAKAGQYEEAFREAAAVLLVVSPAANDSRMLKTETEIAVGHAPIIPVRIADVPPEQALHGLVQGQPGFDLFGDEAELEAERLADALRLLQGLPRRSRKAARKPAPQPIAVAATTETDEAAETIFEHEPAIAAEGPAPLGLNAALRAFVGPRANPFLERWRTMDREDRANNRFLPGLLFGRYWLAYRKLWGQALASTAIALALIGFALWNDANYGQIGTPLLVAGLLGLGILTFLRGVGMYRARAERVVAKWNVASLDDQEATEQLAKRGGTSPIGVAALVVVEGAAAAALAMTLNPGFVAWLTTPAPTVAPPKLDLVSMTEPGDAKARYNFCLENPTDTKIAFTLRYGNGQEQAVSLPAHSGAVTYWSRQIDPPVITFDHILNDGPTTTNLSYGINTARTESEKSCGGIVYAFTISGNDLDLKLRGTQDSAQPQPIGNTAG